MVYPLSFHCHGSIDKNITLLFWNSLTLPSSLITTTTTHSTHNYSSSISLISTSPMLIVSTNNIITLMSYLSLLLLLLLLLLFRLMMPLVLPSNTCWLCATALWLPLKCCWLSGLRPQPNSLLIERLFNHILYLSTNVSMNSTTLILLTHSVLISLSRICGSYSSTTTNNSHSHILNDHTYMHIYIYIYIILLVYLLKKMCNLSKYVS